MTNNTNNLPNENSPIGLNSARRDRWNWRDIVLELVIVFVGLFAAFQLLVKPAECRLGRSGHLAGLTNFSVIRSDSPISRYCCLSLSPSASDGGKVQTPWGCS